MSGWVPTLLQCVLNGGVASCVCVCNYGCVSVTMGMCPVSVQVKGCQ